LKNKVEASSALAAPPENAVPRPLTLCSLKAKLPARLLSGRVKARRERTTRDRMDWRTNDVAICPGRK
jgi:hypothetical protein